MKGAKIRIPYAQTVKAGLDLPLSLGIERAECLNNNFEFVRSKKFASSQYKSIISLIFISVLLTKMNNLEGFYCK